MSLSSFKEYRDQLRKTWKDASQNMDEDSIHDLRVASRRMGASLLLLESVLGADRPSKARRQLKRLMKKLGALRDIQVQVAIVEKWKGTESILKFRESLERTERREKDRARDYLSSYRKKKILQELKDFERDAVKRLKDIPEAAIKTSMEITISVQRINLEAARNARVPTDPRSLHAVRRTARKLRYCLEAAAETVGAASRSELQRLKKTQTELGNQRDQQLLKVKFEEWQRNRG
jgi:CHAD domain-containing protein